MVKGCEYERTKLPQTSGAPVVNKSHRRAATFVWALSQTYHEFNSIYINEPGVAV